MQKKEIHIAKTVQRLVNLQEQMAKNFNNFFKSTTDSQEEKKYKDKTNSLTR